MRIIKFRAWDITHQRMWNWDACKDETAGGFFEEMKWIEIMQFTGLLDKNGKEIYEGDILNNFPQIIKVCWDTTDGKWFGHYIDKKRTSSFWMGEEFKKYEVIGNIYENPDLIKEVINE